MNIVLLRTHRSTAITLAFCLLLSPPAFAALSSSKYLERATDFSITANNVDTTVLTTSITLTSTEWVFAQSDGRWFTGGGGCQAWASVLIGAGSPRNVSGIDWRQSSNIQQHSFNAIAALQLGPGTHTVKLIARKNGPSNLVVGSKTNLSVMVRPAPNVKINTLASSGPYNLTTVNQGTCTGGSLNLPHVQMIANVLGSLPIGSNIVALGSGQAQVYQTGGDAMFGLYLNNKYPGNASATWSVNDLVGFAEHLAPMYNQAFLTTTTSTNTVTLDATEFPIHVENPVQYTTYNSALVTLYGWPVPAPSVVKGKAVVSTQTCGTDSYYYGDYENIATGPTGTFPNWPTWAYSPTPGCQGVPCQSLTQTVTCGPAGFPCPGTDVVIAQTQVTIPSGHNGIVMFVAKGMTVTCDCNNSAIVRLKIKIDDVERGSHGVQSLGIPNVGSTRTLTASYLSVNPALTVGTHNVKLVANVQNLSGQPGAFVTQGFSRHVPLVYFD